MSTTSGPTVPDRMGNVTGADPSEKDRVALRSVIWVLHALLIMRAMHRVGSLAQAATFSSSSDRLSHRWFVGGTFGAGSGFHAERSSRSNGASDASAASARPDSRSHSSLSVKS